MAYKKDKVKRRKPTPDDQKNFKKITSTTWKPGMPSPNPLGAPEKDDTITGLMRKFLNKVPEDKKKTYKEIFVERAFHLAVKEGDMAAIKLIWNYMDGAPRQNLNLSGSVGQAELSPEKHLEIQKALGLLD